MYLLIKIASKRWRLLGIYRYGLDWGIIALIISAFYLNNIPIFVLVVVLLAAPTLLALVDFILSKKSNALTTWAMRRFLARVSKDGKQRELVFLPLDKEGLPEEDAVKKWLFINYPHWNNEVVIGELRRLILAHKQ